MNWDFCIWLGSSPSTEPSGLSENAGYPSKEVAPYSDEPWCWLNSLIISGAYWAFHFAKA